MSPEQPGTCRAAAAAEPLLGSAPTAQQWLVIEHPGPWGARPVEDSLPAELAEAAAEWQGRWPTSKVLLARSPGPHAARDPREPRWVWFADCSAQQPRLRGEQLGLEEAAGLLRGELAPDALAPVADAWFGVCTNGQRDRCCAVAGLPLAREGWLHHPGRVWEISHVGGHRFSPVVLHLPHGYVHGRVTDIIGLIAETDRGVLSQGTLRGRCTRPGKDQVLEALGRAQSQRWGLAEWTDEDQTVAASRLELVRHDGPPRAESCGAEPSASSWWAPRDEATTVL